MFVLHVVCSPSAGLSRPPQKAGTTPNRFNRPFKSPLVRNAPAEPQPQANARKRTRILSSDGGGKRQPNRTDLAELKERESRLDDEIERLRAEGLDVGDLDRQIELLHRYNDVKDAAQVVLGRLAELTGVTVKSLHLKYDLPLADWNGHSVLVSHPPIHSALEFVIFFFLFSNRQKKTGLTDQNATKFDRIRFKKKTGEIWKIERSSFLLKNGTKLSETKLNPMKPG